MAKLCSSPVYSSYPGSGQALGEVSSRDLANPPTRSGQPSMVFTTCRLECQNLQRITNTTRDMGLNFQEREGGRERAGCRAGADALSQARYAIFFLFSVARAFRYRDVQNLKIREREGGGSSRFLRGPSVLLGLAHRFALYAFWNLPCEATLSLVSVSLSGSKLHSWAPSCGVLVLREILCLCCEDPHMPISAAGQGTARDGGRFSKKAEVSACAWKASPGCLTVKVP